MARLMPESAPEKGYKAQLPTAPMDLAEPTNQSLKLISSEIYLF